MEADIFDVIKSGELCEVEKHVEKYGNEILSARDKHGYTPAHWAALDGNVEIMRYLVERNGPVDLPCLGTQGPRPIHWACRKGHGKKILVLKIIRLIWGNFFSVCSSSFVE